MCRLNKKREFIPKEKAASPTVMLESILITATVEVMEEREVTVMDLPGAFLRVENEREVLMKMEGKFADGEAKRGHPGPDPSKYRSK